MRCSKDWIEAAAVEKLEDERLEMLRKHLATCQRCRTRLDEATADARWWRDASRFLDESVLSDPDADAADSSTGDARLFEDDDPIGELRAIGAIDPTTHPEMLGMLGRYTVEREIGSGGMGVVLKAHDAELSRTVAIKVLAPHLARSGAAKQRFIREGRAAAAVVHENVVAIHEVDTSGRLPSLVMRYVDGISLQRHVDLYGPLSVHDALRIGCQTAAGLDAAHRQGIIHRDVKPANILVNHSCNRAWISDFGLARAVDDASLTRTGFIAGTPHYMSPEQARGSDVGPVSDLFSFGAVLYFMFAARPPWRAERSLAVLHRIVQHEHRPLWQINSDIPRSISELVDRLLQKRVEDRPSSAAEVQQILEKALSQLQNPGLINYDAAASVANKPKWFARPWFVAPVAVALTSLAIESYQRNLSQPMNANLTPVEPLEAGQANYADYEAAMPLPTAISGTASMEPAPAETFMNDTPDVTQNEAGSGPVFNHTSSNAVPATPSYEPDNDGNALQWRRPPSDAVNAGQPGGFTQPSIGASDSLSNGLRGTNLPVPSPVLGNESSNAGDMITPANTIPAETWAEIYELEEMLNRVETRFKSTGLASDVKYYEAQ